MDLINLAERAILPDWLIRLGMRRLMANRLRDVNRGDAEEQRERLRQFLGQLRRSPIAIETDAANRQHYDVPPAFFERVLGPRLKYSCCYWPTLHTTLSFEVVMANVADFATTRRFDRVVSVEMFEHVRNYEELFRRIAGWLLPDGKLMVHIFCHRQFAHHNGNEWFVSHYLFSKHPDSTDQG